MSPAPSQRHTELPQCWLHSLSWALLCNYQFVLPNPFTSFTQSPSLLPSGNQQFVLCLWACFNFVSFIYFVLQIPHISEIMCYLSFSHWLISLSLILSRSIHAVTKGKISFFLQPSSVPLCKCTTAFLFSHLLMGTWATPKSWLLQITLLYSSNQFWVSLDIFSEVESLGHRQFHF